MMKWWVVGAVLSENLISSSQADFDLEILQLTKLYFCYNLSGTNFERKNLHAGRRVLATIDSSKVFDSVWHSAFYHKLLTLL